MDRQGRFSCYLLVIHRRPRTEQGVHLSALQVSYQLVPNLVFEEKVLEFMSKQRSLSHMEIQHVLVNRLFLLI